MVCIILYLFQKKQHLPVKSAIIINAYEKLVDLELVNFRISSCHIVEAPPFGRVPPNLGRTPKV